MKIPSYVHLTEIDEKLVLLDTRRNEYHVVNETGKTILLALDEGNSLEEGLKRIKDEFNQAENVEEDVKEFIENLLKAGLLEESS